MTVAEKVPSTDNTTDPMLQYFKWKHLTRPELQAASRPFAQQAARIVRSTPKGPERDIALYRLLESKDAAVRAMLPPEVVTVDDLE